MKPTLFMRCFVAKNEHQKNGVIKPDFRLRSSGAFLLKTDVDQYLFSLVIPLTNKTSDERWSYIIYDLVSRLTKLRATGRMLRAH